MSTILLFMGKSGAGKSTLEKKLIELYPEKFKKVVSHTTREPRVNETIQEKDGLDYHFVSLEKFKELNDSGEFIQTTKIKDTHYASALSEYKSNKDFIILTVVPKEGEKLIKKLNSLGIKNFKSVLFDISDKKIKENLKKDGFSEEVIDQRLKRIDLIKEFNETSLNKDIVVTDELLTEELHEWFLDQVN